MKKIIVLVLCLVMSIVFSEKAAYPVQEETEKPLSTAATEPAPVDIKSAIENLRSKNALERVKAIQELDRAGQGAVKAVPVLISMLGDDETVVQERVDFQLHTQTANQSIKLSWEAGQSDQVANELRNRLLAAEAKAKAVEQERDRLIEEVRKLEVLREGAMKKEEDALNHILRLSKELAKLERAAEDAKETAEAADERARSVEDESKRIEGELSKTDSMKQAAIDEENSVRGEMGRLKSDAENMLDAARKNSEMSALKLKNAEKDVVRLTEAANKAEELKVRAAAEAKAAHNKAMRFDNKGDAAARADSGVKIRIQKEAKRLDRDRARLAKDADSAERLKNAAEKDLGSTREEARKFAAEADLVRDKGHALQARIQELEKRAQAAVKEKGRLADMLLKMERDRQATVKKAVSIRIEAGKLSANAKQAVGLVNIVKKKLKAGKIRLVKARNDKEALIEKMRNVEEAKAAAIKKARAAREEIAPLASQVMRAQKEAKVKIKRADLADKAVSQSIVKVKSPKWTTPGEEAAKVLAKIGGPCVKQLIVKIQESKDDNFRENATWVFLKMNNQNAVKPLLESLEDKDPYIRDRVIRALGNIKDKQATQPLINILVDTDKIIRRDAVWALGEIGDRRATPYLISALRDGSRAVRWNATRALAKMRDPGSVDMIINLTRGQDKDIRYDAVWVLGEIKDRRAIESLITVIRDDKDKDVKYTAAGALKQITGEDFGQDPVTWTKWWQANKKTGK